MDSLKAKVIISYGLQLNALLMNICSQAYKLDKYSYTVELG